MTENERMQELAARIVDRPTTIETYSDDPSERYSLLHDAQELARLVKKGCER